MCPPSHQADSHQPANPLSFVSELSDFASSTGLHLLHLNIQSLSMKVYELDLILKQANYDIVLISETHITLDSHPRSFYSNSNFTMLRRDKSRHSGGLIAFVKDHLKVAAPDIHEDISDFDCISFIIQINSTRMNFVACYKPPCFDNTRFLDELEDILLSLDQSDPTFIVGDLNMDLLSDNGEKLRQFIQANHLANFIDKPTRTATRVISDNQQSATSQTLIDVILHNSDRIKSTSSINCSFSDHNFIVVKILTTHLAPHQPRAIMSRKLNRDKLDQLQILFSLHPAPHFNRILSNEDNWLNIKSHILQQLDTIAPLVKITIKHSAVHPWIDDDLRFLKHARDLAYKKYKISNNNDDFLWYKHCCQTHDKSLNNKMITFFSTCKLNNFNSPSQFWKFHSSLVNIKSCQTNKPTILSINHNSNIYTDPYDIANLFNKHFTYIKSQSTATLNE